MEWSVSRLKQLKQTLKYDFASVDLNLLHVGENANTSELKFLLPPKLLTFLGRSSSSLRFTPKLVTFLETRLSTGRICKGIYVGESDATFL